MRSGEHVLDGLGPNDHVSVLFLLHSDPYKPLIGTCFSHISKRIIPPRLGKMGQDMTERGKESGEWYLKGYGRQKNIPRLQEVELGTECPRHNSIEIENFMHRKSPSNCHSLGQGFTEVLRV